MTAPILLHVGTSEATRGPGSAVVYAHGGFYLNDPNSMMRGGLHVLPYYYSTQSKEGAVRGTHCTGPAFSLREHASRGSSYGLVPAKSGDPDDLISDQYWETRKHYEDYFKWRADNGSGAKFQDLCVEPISYRFFNVVSEPTNDSSLNKSRTCHVIIQHKTKNGRSKDLVELIRRTIVQSIHGGCLKVSIQQNQDDPNDIISDQYWETRKHYEDYFKWWADTGGRAQLQEMCMEPISSRFFGEVLSGASPSGS